MGVYISGKVIKKIPVYSEDSLEVFTYKGFERSLQKEEIVTIDFDAENYEYVGNGVSMSYSGYNSFRQSLSFAALGISANKVWEIASNLKDNEDYPQAIYHIINFADNEGFIGPKAVKELDEYFKENFESIKNKLQEDNEFHASCFEDLVDCVSITAKNNGYLQYS